MKIVSWNVNGIAACRRRGFLKFLKSADPDIVCCQEIKTETEIPLNTPGYLQFWNPAKRKNYSGTLTLTKPQPLNCTYGMGIEKFDEEGRLITLEYQNFCVVNVYVPSFNVRSPLNRKEYRMEWDEALRGYVSALPKPAILCGDFNVISEDIDIYPTEKRGTIDEFDFQWEEREGFHNLLKAGFVDAFRILHPERKGAYTWWSPKNNNRPENRGSRLDYFLVSGPMLGMVRSVKHHTDNLCSDHCPISMLIAQQKIQPDFSRQDYTNIWRAIDWNQMEQQLWAMQKELSLAAYYRDWDKVEKLQKGLVSSWTAKAMAVRNVVASNSAAGIDGVKWKTDEEKALAALSLTPRGYQPLPYRHQEVVDGERRRVIHIPTARDKAMMVLYAYALDPVSEATADKRSFSARKGRSVFDVHSYLMRDLSGNDAPHWVVVVDIKAYYSSISHEWLLDNIPMDRSMLKKFLQAGVLKHGNLFKTDKGISLGTSLSPILGNMLLDGLQSYIYDHLYPQGNVDYLDGGAIRYADDIIITSRNRERAELIMEIVCGFLQKRGLGINHEKSLITNTKDGFHFLSHYYRRERNRIIAQPRESSVLKIEQELENLILNSRASYRLLIEKINRKLSGWATYHRVTDSYLVFRHIDSVVNALLLRRMFDRHKHWHKDTILNKYWINDGGDRVFVLPSNPSVRVIQLAPLSIVSHKPCKTDFNPYLDERYYNVLKYRQEIQRASGKYQAIWRRQGGKCAYCGSPMLADQEVDVVEKNLGEGWKIRNLLYVHKRCAEDIFCHEGNGTSQRLDLCELLDDLVNPISPQNSPYRELTEFFRLCERNSFTMHFYNFEDILGDQLDWEAYFFEAVWYDDTPERLSPLWRKENFPYRIFLPSTPDYCIADSWLSQGYTIKKLDLVRERVSFRRINKSVSGLKIPKALLTQKLPNAAVHELEQAFISVIKKYGL